MPRCHHCLWIYLGMSKRTNVISSATFLLQIESAKCRRGVGSKMEQDILLKLEDSRIDVIIFVKPSLKRLKAN